MNLIPPNYSPNTLLTREYTPGFRNSNKACSCLKGVCSTRTSRCLPSRSVGEAFISEVQHIKLLIGRGMTYEGGSEGGLLVFDRRE